MASLCHPWFTTTNLSYRFPIFETSATALCGTTGTLTFTAKLHQVTPLRQLVMPLLEWSILYDIADIVILCYFHALVWGTLGPDMTIQYQVLPPRASRRFQVWMEIRLAVAELHRHLNWCGMSQEPSEGDRMGCLNIPGGCLEDALELSLLGILRDFWSARWHD